MLIRIRSFEIELHRSSLFVRLPFIGEAYFELDRSNGLRCWAMRHEDRGTEFRLGWLRGAVSGC